MTAAAIRVEVATKTALPYRHRQAHQPPGGCDGAGEQPFSRAGDARPVPEARTRHRARCQTDHEKLSLEVLDNETKSRAFALVILKMLKSVGLDESGLRGF